LSEKAMAWLLLGVCFAQFFSCLAEHPCEAEVNVACPDTPGSELGRCLRNPEEHETPTTLSSECTDFVALNLACAEDIESHCDDAFFTDDTTPCLTQWTDSSSLTQRCTSVMSWAVPQLLEAEEEPITDELGLSDEDYAEKMEWQAKRKAEREEAIKKLKEMKAIDAERERERVEMEKFKREDPEGYRLMLEQQEEDKRQAAEVKKRERMMAAALERKRKQEAGITDEEEPKQAPKSKKPKKERTEEAPTKPGNSGGSWLKALGCLGLVAGAALLGYKVLVDMQKEAEKNRPVKREKKNKKKNN